MNNLPTDPTAIPLYDDEDDKTELGVPLFAEGKKPEARATPAKPGPAPVAAPFGAYSLDDDDDERTEIVKRPGPPR